MSIIVFYGAKFKNTVVPKCKLFFIPFTVLLTPKPKIHWPIKRLILRSNISVWNTFLQHESPFVHDYLYRVFLFYDTFLTSSCERNFEDIDLRFFANCKGRIIVFFSICNMWSFTHNVFLKLKIWKRTNFTKKCTPVWILTMFSFDNPYWMSCYFYKNENIDVAGSFVSFS